MLPKRAHVLLWTAAAASLVLSVYLLGSASPGTWNLLSQMGIAVLVCASYGLLLGHTGLLSFGHAVYPAIGAYVGVYVLHSLAPWGWGNPAAVALVPLVSGLGAMLVALVLGWPQVRRSGTVFGMVTLGIGELFYALALAFSGISGGEGGISANRVMGQPILGVRWASGQEVMCLVAVYLLAGLMLYRGLLMSVPGRLMHAVRDNPLRVTFTGVNPVGVRFLALLVSAFLAGVAGGLGALLFEMATPEAFNTHRSAQYLVFSVLGGTGSLLGAVLGGVLMVGATVWLSTLTAAWLFYTGLGFFAVVLLVPGGLAQVVIKLKFMAPWLLGMSRACSVASAGAGVGVLTELGYHHFNLTQVASDFTLLGFKFSPKSVSDWALGLAFLAGGCLAGWRSGLPAPKVYK